MDDAFQSLSSAGRKHWCGAVQRRALQWISLAGGFAESGGWFCTRYAQTGKLYGHKSTASVRCLEADATTNCSWRQTAPS